MIIFDNVKTRLEIEQALSYMELDYIIHQAYDFLEVKRKKNCTECCGK